MKKHENLKEENMNWKKWLARYELCSYHPGYPVVELHSPTLCVVRTEESLWRGESPYKKGAKSRTEALWATPMITVVSRKYRKPPKWAANLPHFFVW